MENATCEPKTRALSEGISVTEAWAWTLQANSPEPQPGGARSATGTESSWGRKGPPQQPKWVLLSSSTGRETSSTQMILWLTQLSNSASSKQVPHDFPLHVKDAHVFHLVQGPRLRASCMLNTHSAAARLAWASVGCLHFPHFSRSVLLTRSTARLRTVSPTTGASSPRESLQNVPMLLASYRRFLSKC